MTDFLVEPTETNRHNGHIIMEATLLHDYNVSTLVYQREEEPKDLVHLVETIAHSISSPHPISHWEKL